MNIFVPVTASTLISIALYSLLLILEHVTLRGNLNRSLKTHSNNDFIQINIIEDTLQEYELDMYRYMSFLGYYNISISVNLLVIYCSQVILTLVFI
jgi:hypothetical protein